MENRKRFSITKTILSLALIVTSVINVPSFVKAETNYQTQEKVLAILVEFDEKLPHDPSKNYPSTYDGSIKNSEAEFNQMIFGTGIDTGTGYYKKTVRNYFREVSNEKLDLVPAEENWGAINDGIIRVKLGYGHPNKYSTEQYKTGCLVADEQIRICHDVLKYIDKNSLIDISSFDTDNNGLISVRELNLVFLLANADPYPTLRSNFLTGYQFPITLDNKTLFSEYTPIVSPGFIMSKAKINSASVLCHEISHTFGAKDLYNDVDFNHTESQSIMSDDYYFSHLDPFHKIRAGFVSPQLATVSGEYTVNSVSASDPSKYNVLKVPINTLGNEYFLIENRQFSGFDYGMKKTLISGGIAIWHIKERKGEKPYESLSDFRLEQSEDKSKTYFNNYFNCFYFSGGQNPEGVTTFGPNTLPSNSKRFDGTDSGVTISVNSESSSTMKVSVNILSAPKNFKATAYGAYTKLTWDAIPNITQYELCIDKGAFFSVGANTSYMIKNLNTHCYKIRAKDTTRTGYESRELDARSILIGDINGDGNITSEDKDILKSFLIDCTDLKDAQKVAADVNGDNVLDTADLMYLGKYISKTISSFPAGVMKLIRYGDVNLDGFITLDDYNICKNRLDNETPFTSFEQRTAADSNYDSIIDNIDSCNIQEYILGLRESFPVMFK